MDQNSYYYPQYPGQLPEDSPSIQSTTNETVKQIDRGIDLFAKTIATLILGFFSLYYFTSERPWTIVDAADLMIHEVGHFVWMFAGEFMGILGGSLTQLLVPIGFGIYFFLYKRWYSLLFTLYWLGINLIYVAIYISDARAQVLPLINDNSIHDWNYLLIRLSLLEYDQTIGSFMQWIGKLCILGSLIAMVVHIFRLFLTRKQISH